MPIKKQYKHYLCKDCDVDFITSQGNNCPNCADNVYVDVIRTIWLDRGFNYKRPWTDDEDEMILAGRKLGKTYAEIAKEINRTTKATTNRFYYIRRR